MNVIDQISWPGRERTQNIARFLHLVVTEGFSSKLLSAEDRAEF